MLLAVATVILVAGVVANAAAGHGWWGTGFVGWVAILVAVGAGAGTDNAAGVVGLGGVVAWLRRRAAEADRPRNDADWS